MIGNTDSAAPQKCSGFTLIELLLVLGMLVMLVAMAWPTYEGFVADQKLLAAAEQFRNDLREARRWAIESGVAIRCALATASGAYRIEGAIPVDGRNGRVMGQAGTEAATAGERKEMELPLGIVFRHEPGVSIRGEALEPLPTGAPQEIAPATAGRLRGTPQLEQAQALPPAADLPPWCEFYPDGSASAGSVWLVDVRGHAVEIRLEALTGETSIGEPRAPETDLGPSAEEQR